MSIEALEASFYADRRVMVTGGRGFLGRAVVAQLQASGAQVISLGRADGDLTEQGDVRRVIGALPRRRRSVRRVHQQSPTR